ncbi:MAG: M23 family metallopeptidase [Firmicutes bacterium]|nr:M23 family metallopeptidase [Bacillota bacterium]
MRREVLVPPEPHIDVYREDDADRWVRKMDYQNEVEEVDWLAAEEGAGDDDRERFWRQAEKIFVVALVVCALLVLKTAGRPGRWLLARLRTAVTVDFSATVARLGSPEKVRALLATLRERLAREWQVNGPRLQNQAGPPRFFWPLEEASPVASTLLSPRNRGLDLRAAAGSLVLAAAAGTITEVRRERDGSFTLVLDHGQGWRTVYERCRTALVGPGAFIAARQPIGILGSAPPPLPAYLHFEIWQGATPLAPGALLRSGSI